MGVIKKRRTTKKKVVTGEDGQPVVTEEVFDEEIPEAFDVTITDEKESVVEGVVKPVITEVREDATTYAEIKVEEIVDKLGIHVDDKDTEKITDNEGREVKKKKVIKKRRTTKKKVVAGEDGHPVVTEEVFEEEIPEAFDVTITDEKESVVEGVVKPVITEVREDATTYAEIKVEEIVDKVEILVDDNDTEKITDNEGREVKKKKVIKKRRTTKKKVVAGEDG